MVDDITTIKGIEQGRAKFAYDCVEKAKNDKKYKGHIKKIPVYITTNGLGATLAFIFGKDDTYKTIYSHIESWLREDQKKLIELSGQKKLVEEITNIDSPQYRAITIEVLAFVNWLRRFADGLIEGEDEGNQ
ncbi:MAG: type III-B CRISPR module-associated protein Cmr5 [Thermoprotei archaeon]|nr:MAG: type III-B CRISPR module-associated protein Cmr5 [Thermoprotei archaeon]